MDLFIERLSSEEGEGAWHVDSSLFGNSEDCGGNEDIPDSSPGGDTAVPGLGARVGDDDVGPDHLETAESDACENGDEGAGERVTEAVGAEEADDAAVEKVIDD